VGGSIDLDNFLRVRSSATEAACKGDQEDGQIPGSIRQSFHVNQNSSDTEVASVCFRAAKPDRLEDLEQVVILIGPKPQISWDRNRLRNVFNHG
jgi:hypothetical protein